MQFPLSAIPGREENMNWTTQTHMKEKFVMKMNKSCLSATFAFVVLCLFYSPIASAHCDSLDGPLVSEAKIALEKADVTPLLKWVQAAEENTIRTAFQKTVALRSKGADVKEMADTYFLETLVRIHRAGEGASYTGLKPAGEVDPAVALADKALESGNPDKLVSALVHGMEGGLLERFRHALETRKHSNESTAAGRKFIEAYVAFTHYVEGLHKLVKTGAGHHEKAGH